MWVNECVCACAHECALDGERSMMFASSRAVCSMDGSVSDSMDGHVSDRLQ